MTGYERYSHLRRSVHTALMLYVAAILGSSGCASSQLKTEVDELKTAMAQLRQEQAVQRTAIETLRADEEKAQATQREELDSLRADLEAERRERAAAVRPSAKDVVKDAGKVYAMPLGDSPVEGPKDAWVTIVEVSDFQCPFCGRAQPTLHQLRERYEKSVRFAFKHNPLPFHVHAMPAALASECARAQGQFWPYASALFENQNALADSDLQEYARKTPGLDPAAFSQCFEKKNHAGRIRADMDLAKKLGVNGTPTFFVNGRLVVGAQPIENFAAIIDEELAKAKKSGISAGSYYDRAVLQRATRLAQ